MRTARAIVFKSRQDAYLYPNSAWFTCFIGGSYEFLSQPGVRDQDALVHFIYYATAVTPAMAAKLIGLGSQYAAAATDSEGKPLDGGKTYKIHLPPNIPAKDFWSSWSMTIKLARCSRLIGSFRALEVRERNLSSTQTLLWTSGWAQALRQATKPTGFRPCLVKAGMSFSDSTARSNRGSTKPGNRENSHW
jgi:Protein of unknown function (DUF1214)